MFKQLLLYKLLIPEFTVLTANININDKTAVHNLKQFVKKML